MGKLQLLKKYEVKPMYKQEVTEKNVNCLGGGELR